MKFRALILTSRIFFGSFVKGSVKQDSYNSVKVNSKNGVDMKYCTAIILFRRK